VLFCQPFASADHATAAHQSILENVSIAMHCNLRPPDAAPVLVPFNYDARAKSEVAQPICCCLIEFLLLINPNLVKLYPFLTCSG